MIRQLPAMEKPVDLERDRIEQTLEERDALERDRAKLANSVVAQHPGETARIQRLADFARGTLPKNQVVSTKDLEWAHARPDVTAFMDANQNLTQAEKILQSAGRPNVVGHLFKQEPREPGVIPEGYPQEHLAPIEEETP